MSVTFDPFWAKLDSASIYRSCTLHNDLHVSESQPFAMVRCEVHAEDEVRIDYRIFFPPSKVRAEVQEHFV